MPQIRKPESTLAANKKRLETQPLESRELTRDLPAGVNPLEGPEEGAKIVDFRGATPE